MSTFGERLKIAFHNAKNAEIARKLGVSESAVKNYMDGRVPDSDKLIKITSLTNCNLHWLITGQGVKFLDEGQAFDLEYSIEKHDSWRGVMEDWFAFDGREMPDTMGASFMGGWESFDRKRKIAALQDLKMLLDRIADGND
jgi:transcriptional regulator with XRE-family HTH domain